MSATTENPASNAAEYANFIPAAVRRQSVRADEISQQVYHSPVEEPVAEEPVVAEPVVAPAAEVVPPAPAPAAEPDYKQQYLTLQGKYNSEVPGLRAELEGLRRVVAAMNEAKAAPVEPQKQTTTVVEIPEKDVEEFGPDLIARARAWARAELAPELDEIRQIKSELGNVKTTHQQEQAQSAAQRVLTAMDNDPEWGAATNNADPELHNRWRMINKDQRFLDWLNQSDPFTGQVRMSVLRDAFNAGNVQRLKVVFGTFVREHTVPQTAPAEQPSHTSQEAAKPTLEQFAMPGRGNGAAQVGASNEKRVWTQASIAAFYRDCTRNAYEGKAPLRQQLEQDIIAAATEGRIQ